MKVEEAVLGSPSLTVPMVSVDVNTDPEFIGSEFSSCVKAEAAVLGSPSLVVPTVSVDVKQH